MKVRSRKKGKVSRKVILSYMHKYRRRSFHGRDPGAINHSVEFQPQRPEQAA